MAYKLDFLNGSDISLIREAERRSGEMIAVEPHLEDLAVVADMSPLMLFILGQNAELLYGNKVFSNTLGLGPERVCDAGWRGYIHPDDRARREAVVVSSVRNRERYSVEIRIRDVSGAYRWYLESAAPQIFQDGSAYYMGTCLDISERKDAETAYFQAAGGLEAKRNFLFAQVTHELRNPLNTVMTSLGMCLEGLFGPMTPKQSEYVRLANESARYLLHLINEMLDMARLQQGRLAVRPLAIRLQDLLADVRWEFEPILSVCGQTLDFRMSEGLPDTIHADPIRLRQAIGNLLANAHKFSPPGARITLGCEAREDRIAVFVRDEGPGIPGELIPRIRLPYEQGPQEPSLQNKGLGLGLFLADEIIKQHGGAMEIESHPGQGSVFTLLVPCG